MPPRKQTPEMTTEEELAPENQDKGNPVSEPKQEQTPPKLCGHVNKHFINYKRKLEDLSCDLPAGHTEPNQKLVNSDTVMVIHQADYEHYEHCSPDDDGAVMIGGNAYKLTKDRAEWLDSAGVPAAQIKRDIESLREIRRIRAIEEEGKYI